MRDRCLEKLLSMLDEPDVRSKIRRIAKDASQTQEPDAPKPDAPKPDAGGREWQIRQMRDEIMRLKTIIEESRQDSEKEKIKIRQLQDALDQKSAQLSGARQAAERDRAQLEESKNELRKARGALEVYRTWFDLPLGLYEQYCSLPRDILEALGQILSSKSVTEFLVRGVQWDNLEGLEAYILANVSRGAATGETDVLRRVYDELFRLYCMAHSNCSRLNTKIGDPFDSEYHTRGHGSRGVSGRIENVLFDGYRKGNTVRKSVVWVEG